MGAAAVERADERGEPRDEVLLRVRIIDAAGRETMTTVVNLSPGGLMARSDAPVRPGDLLAADLPLVGRMRMEVRWALGGRVGCRFEQAIAPQSYHALLARARRA